ncbi:MAG: M42 family metallopeptidase [Planctomycetaceae bacterium]|jgi:endoglucanase|nr:M42 family metallopeptidase [Planctomycetaceae bacterium]
MSQDETSTSVQPVITEAEILRRIGDTAYNFFSETLNTPSVTGFEMPVQQLVRDYISPHCDSVVTDEHGNVAAALHPNAPKRIMLAGHCDQIGMLISYIDNEGFLYAVTVGGWDIVQLVGQRVKIWTKGGAVSGVLGRKPIHLMDDDDRKKVPKIKDLWIDIGAKDKEEAESLVTVGDPITVELTVMRMRNALLAAAATDDKAGMWVVMEALRRIDKNKLHPEVGVFAVSTVQEEIGLRGAKTSAFGIDPQIGIAVDVTFATDCPTIEKKQNGDVKLGAGPVVSRGPNMSVKLVNAISEIAKSNEIPVQYCAEGRATGTDANSIQVNRAGVATALISIPNRYMHSPVEVISLADIDNAANLLARYCESVKPDTNYIPSV